MRLRSYLFETHPAVDVRLHAAQQGALQSGHDGHIAVSQLAHQVHGEPLHDVGLGAGKALGIEIGRAVFCNGLVGNSPGLRMMHVKLRFNHLRHIFPAVIFQTAEDGLHPFECGHSVIIHQPTAAQASNLVDDVRLGLEEKPDEAGKFLVRGCAGEGGHRRLSPINVVFDDCDHAHEQIQDKCARNDKQSNRFYIRIESKRFFHGILLKTGNKKPRCICIVVLSGT